MMNMLFAWLVSAAILWGMAEILHGITVANFTTALWVIALFGVMNATIRPIITFFTLPLNFLTLGLFSLVINAALFGLGAYFITGFSVASVWDALLGSVLLSLTTAILLGSGKRKQAWQ